MLFTRALGRLPRRRAPIGRGASGGARGGRPRGGAGASRSVEHFVAASAVVASGSVLDRGRRPVDADGRRGGARHVLAVFRAERLHGHHRAVGAACAGFKSSNRRQCARTRQFRRTLFGCASRNRREQSIRPKISRIDFDLTELESSEVWSGPPEPVVDFHTGRRRGVGDCAEFNHWFGGS